MLVAFRQGFDPLHIIEAPHSKIVQVNSVSSLKLPKETERTLYYAMFISSGIVYLTDEACGEIYSLLMDEALCGKAMLDQFDQWLQANKYRWIALMDD